MVICACAGELADKRVAEFFVSLPWLLSALILCLGCAVQTALGFGMAVLAAPVMLLVRPEWVPYAPASTALVLSAVNTCYLRKHLAYKNILPALISRIPGTAVGAWLLLAINTLWLQLVVALAVFIAVGVSLFAVHFAATPRRLAWAGFISGFMGTTTAIGGPPMALVMQFGEPRRVRANLSFYFTYSCILSLLSYAIAGLLSRQMLLVCLSFVPSALLGFALGRRLQGWVNQQRFRPLLLGLCAISANFALAGVLWKVLV